MPLWYLGVIFYLFYFLKRCNKYVCTDKTVMNLGDIWLNIEVMMFLYQIMNGVIFLLVCYLTKIKPFMRDHYELENDTNPWNNRNTEDYLRHMKLEFFMITIQMNGIMSVLTIGTF